MSNDADRQRRGRVAVGIGRPLHKLGKVVQKCKFNWICYAFFILRESFRRGVRQETERHEEERNSPDSARSKPGHRAPTPTAFPVIPVLDANICHWNRYPTLI